MTAPNLVFAQYVAGKTTTISATTNLTTLLTNPAASDKMLKVSAITASNVSANNAALNLILTKVTGDLAVLGKLTHEIVVPTAANLMIVTRNAPIYLEEEMTLLISASADNAVEIVCSYEEVM